MLMLPPISICCGECRFVFALPCPATDLVRLATLLRRANWTAIPLTAGDRLASLQRLILTNPALYLFCSATYRNKVGCRFQSFDHLMRWCETNLLDSFDAAGRGWSGWTDSHRAPLNLPASTLELPGTTSFQYLGQPILKRCLKRYLLRQQDSESIQSLAEFLVVATECSAEIAGNCLQELFGDSLSFPDRQAFSKQKHRIQRRVIYETWRQTAADTLNVEAVFGLHRQIADADNEFQVRLWQSKMAAMKQLAYGASHEINNPLANIATRAQTLLAGESNSERQHKLAVIYEQALRAHEMISDLMLFANPPELVLINIDLRGWLSNLIRELEPSLILPAAEKNGAAAANGESRRIELQVRLGPGLQQLQGDPQHLGAALKLLIRNSIESVRATSGSGNIGLRVFRQAAGWVCFSVTDDGAGIPPAIRAHLFDPFFSGREAGRGLGFGLSKAWRVAEMHAGELEFDPCYSPGARFEMRIPLDRPDDLGIDAGLSDRVV